MDYQYTPLNFKNSFVAKIRKKTNSTLVKIFPSETKKNE